MPAVRAQTQEEFGGSARESNPPRTPFNAPLLVLKTRPVTRLDPLPQRILRIFLKWSIEVLDGKFSDERLGVDTNRHRVDFSVALSRRVG